MSKIIAFGHKKGVGKNTAAKFLNTALRVAAPHLTIKHVSFAAKLKSIAYQLYAWAGLKPGIYYETHYQEKEIILPELNLSPREIWIQIGNKLREIYPETWIQYVLQGIDADIIIISDLRFQNEALAVRKAGGMLIKIERSNMPQGTDPAEIDLNNWTDWDGIISNNLTLDDLNTEIECWADVILEE